MTADQIREYVRLKCLEPARLNDRGRFSVRCGTIERELGISNRTALVCNALKSAKFLEPNGLRLVETISPRSRTSTTVVYTYEFRDSAPKSTTSNASNTASIYAKLRQMEGILHDVYRELGSSEQAIREERKGYSR
jgi:hypothetical protein